MPRYDYRCGLGHVTDARRPVSVDVIYCGCGRQARRQPFSRGHEPGVSGFVPTPTRERYINLPRAIEAQHQIVHDAERAHVLAPDLWQIALDRVRRGDVKEIA